MANTGEMKVILVLTSTWRDGNYKGQGGGMPCVNIHASAATQLPTIAHENHKTGPFQDMSVLGSNTPTFVSKRDAA